MNSLIESAPAMGEKKKILIYTDGACSGNPGPGGLGATLRWGAHLKKIMGYLPYTTNNQMELLAPILALSSLKERCVVNIYTDSVYVKDGITSWIKNWKANNWRTAKRQPVKNASLWQELDRLCSSHKVSWHWVKGHSGHPENEEVDALARLSIEKQAPLLKDYLYLAEGTK